MDSSEENGRRTERTAKLTHQATVPHVFFHTGNAPRLLTPYLYLLRVGREAHRQVYSLDILGKAADGNAVHAAFCYGTNVVEGDAA